MLVPIQVERVGAGGCGDESDCENDAEEFIDEDSDPQFATWVVDPAASADANNCYGVFTKDALEGMKLAYMETL